MPDARRSARTDAMPGSFRDSDGKLDEPARGANDLLLSPVYAFRANRSFRSICEYFAGATVQIGAESRRVAPGYVRVHSD
ncbi:hypothetical protein NM688_g5038 [Phlebia brevispora]|uniref:Uncharacterized protein n=1 Tax=Phlebia brevispora TaxID=194682 RepID=A0ACC1T186_9APHY|nr:hypothetical protein NM688_g5038 [Phlebia brevispora]